MIGTTSSSNISIATEPATGQSRLAKNSSESTRPIISWSVGPSSEGITYSPTAGNEHQQRTGNNAGNRQRQRHPEKRRCRPRTQVRGGLQQRLIVLLKIAVQRQDHERQVRIDDADVHRKVVCIIVIGSWMTPSAISTLLITPLFFSSPIHA